ncbi:hypothetical protein PISMIDRAFT_687139, partial [Pisolithus microcarpus 441]
EGVSLKTHSHAWESGSGYNTELGVFSSIHGFLPIMGLLETLHLRSSLFPETI